MPKKYSLKYKRDFQKVFKKGKFNRTKHFSLLTLPSEEIKVAVTIKKKIIKKASSRNYCKRVIKHMLREEILPNLKSHYYFIIFPQMDIKFLKEEIGMEELKKEFKKLFWYNLLKDEI